ncbi:MAG: hypothetical protein M1818_006187 [Claussenomyces sp. TS43310]|nr:MAG: hypothetical protein M1818_006187 [Claussenomyces sp. TS43310]
MWSDICAAFLLHFSADLQFLHEGTLFGFVGQADRKAEEQDFLLGILTLTARFIPELVAHHSPGTGNPRAASEFYASALASRLDASTLAKPSLERCQALLMLGLYCWGECRSAQSWMWTGCAISMAELLGLFFQEDPEPDPRSRSLGLPEDVRKDESKRLGVQYRPSTLTRPSATDTREACVKKEIRRRTMYSIFILDRYMASGRRRRQRIRVEELKVQLPCSDSDFRFGHNVKTGYLYTEGSEYARDQNLDASQGLRIYIQLVEIWSKLSQWSFQGGRRKEPHPPWDPRSGFFNLRKQFDDFHASLPEKLALSPFITENHINTRDLTVYIAIHTLYCLCRIVLHREYIPFIAIGCDRPSGPLDEPLLPKDKYDVPPGFWEESAEHIFKAAKDIMDIIRITSQRGFLVESPPVAFAVWTAAFVGTYSINFPHMDQKEYMCDMKHSKTFPEGDDQQWPGRTGLAIKTLRDMRPKMQMAQGWLNTIRRMFYYFVEIQSDHKKAISEASSNENDAAAALKYLRTGGTDGGLREYELVEKELAEFGRLDERSTNTGSEGGDRCRSRANTRGLSVTPQVKDEHMQGLEGVPSRNTEGRWAAVNDTPPTNGSGGYRHSTANNHDFGAHEAASALTHGSYYQHLRGPSTTGSSLLSPPSTSTPSNHDSPFNHPTSSFHGNGGPNSQQQLPPPSGYPASGAKSSQSHFSPWTYDRSDGAAAASRSQPAKGAPPTSPSSSSLRQYGSIVMTGDTAAFGQGTPIEEWGDGLMDMYGDGMYHGLEFSPDFMYELYHSTHLAG